MDLWNKWEKLFINSVTTVKKVVSKTVCVRLEFYTGLESTCVLNQAGSEIGLNIFLKL